MNIITPEQRHRIALGRAYGYSGLLLDNEKLTTVMRKAFVEQSMTENPPVEHIYAEPSLLLLQRVVGAELEYAVLSVEGVGWTKRKNAGIVQYDHQIEHIEVPTRMFWQAVPIPTTDIVECATEKRIEVADHIRVFGSRLDSNCYLWTRWMQGH